ncbi:MAG TPA: hypothetical protein VND40_03050 [Nitrososphaerales archaeon]|nr:hypothetical protein [Nitrososphaerales archaeon]
MATIVPTSDPIEAKARQQRIGLDDVFGKRAVSYRHEVYRDKETAQSGDVAAQDEKPHDEPDQPYLEVNQPQACSEGVECEICERAAAEYDQPTNKELQDRDGSAVASSYLPPSLQSGLRGFRGTLAGDLRASGDGLLRRRETDR